jgi:hypothetical protein
VVATQLLLVPAAKVALLLGCAVVRMQGSVHGGARQHIRTASAAADTDLLVHAAAPGGVCSDVLAIPRIAATVVLRISTAAGAAAFSGPFRGHPMVGNGCNGSSSRR